LDLKPGKQAGDWAMRELAVMTSQHVCRLGVV